MQQNPSMGTNTRLKWNRLCEPCQSSFNDAFAKKLRSKDPQPGEFELRSLKHPGMLPASKDSCHFCLMVFQEVELYLRRGASNLLPTNPSLSRDLEDAARISIVLDDNEILGARLIIKIDHDIRPGNAVNTQLEIGEVVGVPAMISENLTQRT